MSSVHVTSNEGEPEGEPFVIILIFILILSYIIISALIYFIIIICEKYKCCQPLATILLCIQLLLLLPGTPIFCICILVWKQCIPQNIIDLYKKNQIEATLIYIFGGAVSTASIISVLYTYYYGPSNALFATMISFAVLTIILAVIYFKTNNNIKLTIFALLPLAMLFLITFGTICIFSYVGIYTFNIHKQIDNAHSSYLLQKKEFWILYRFSNKIKRVNKVNIFQMLFAIILSIIYFPITCISSLFWGFGQIERDILIFPIISLIVPAISSLIFWTSLIAVVYTKIIPSAITSSINHLHPLRPFGSLHWLLPLMIIIMNAITLTVTALLTFRDQRNSWLYNIFCVIPGVFLIGPFILLLCPWWVRCSLNISWFLWDLIYFNILRFQNKFAPNHNNNVAVALLEGNNMAPNVVNNINDNVAVQLLDENNVLNVVDNDNDNDNVAVQLLDENNIGPGAVIKVPFSQSNTWKHIRCIGVLLWLPLTIPSILFYPFTYLLQPLLYFGFAAFIAPFCASLLFWVSFVIYMLDYAYSDDIELALRLLMCVSFIVIAILSLMPLNKKQINLQQNELRQLSLDYKYRLRFPSHFISLWLSSFGVSFALFIWPFWILSECKYCLQTIKQLWINDKNIAFNGKQRAKPFAFWHIRRYEVSEFDCKRISMAISFVFTLVFAPIFVVGWVLTGFSRHIYAFTPKFWVIAFVISALFWSSLSYSIWNTDLAVFGVCLVAFILLLVYTMFLSPRNNQNGKCKYLIEFIALFYSILFFAPYNIFLIYWLSRNTLRYYLRCIYSWELLCTVPCIRSKHNQREEYLINVSIQPNTSIRTVFAKVSFDLGYSDDRILKYAETLQKLWFFRAIDLYDIPDSLWQELKLKYVFKASLFDIKDTLKKTQSFQQYKESAVVDTDIRDLLNEFLAINDFESARNEIQILVQQLDELCLLNVCKLKQYISYKQWTALRAPQHLKTILYKKFELKFAANMEGEEQKYNARHVQPSFDGAEDEEEDVVDVPAAFELSVPPQIAMFVEENAPIARRGNINGNGDDYGSMIVPLLQSEQNNADGDNIDDYKYDPMELLDPRDTLQQVATKIAQVQ